jgi:hypothetical protein
MLDICESRFWVLLKRYRQSPESFRIAYEQRTPVDPLFPAGRHPQAMQVGLLFEFSETMSLADLAANFVPAGFSFARNRVVAQGQSGQLGV